MIRRTTTDLLRALDDGARTGRWTAGRKAAALQLLALGVLTEDRLFERYGVETHEIDEWRTRAKRFGAIGLAARKLQEVGR